VGGEVTNELHRLRIQKPAAESVVYFHLNGWLWADPKDYYNTETILAHIIEGLRCISVPELTRYLNELPVLTW
jgi:hypothetical protein